MAAAVPPRSCCPPPAPAPANCQQHARVLKLEVLNKHIRSIRSKGARKDSTIHNFTDVYNHLWDRSRPTIVEMERKIQRRPVKLMIATQIESLVESMFEEEEDCG